jgi:hypothetical protein
MEDVLFRGDREPTLDEILAEPIVRATMARDGITEVQIRQLMKRANTQPPATKHQWITLSPDDDPDDPPPRSPGIIAKTTPPWPRVSPSL